MKMKVPQKVAMVFTKIGDVMEFIGMLLVVSVLIFPKLLMWMWQDWKERKTILLVREDGAILSARSAKDVETLTGIDAKLVGKLKWKSMFGHVLHPQMGYFFNGDDGNRYAFKEHI